jgi:hypothetical protein
MSRGNCIYLPASAATALLVCALVLAGGAALPWNTQTTTYSTSIPAAMPPVLVCLLTSAAAKPFVAAPSLEIVVAMSFSTAFSAFWPPVVCSQENVWCGKDIKYQYLSALSAWLLGVVNLSLF